MRVRDQEIIVKKVVKALEEKGLQDLETRFGNHSQVKFLEDLVEEFITVKKKLSKLRDQEDALQKSIDKGVEDFNDDLDHPGGDPEGRAHKELHGDLIFEGRHGNSIRIGSRNKNPNLIQ